MFGILDRHYKVLITSLVLLLVVGYVHKLFWPHKGDEQFEYGYYAFEKWKEGKMRWTWRKASMRIEAVSDLFGIKVIAAGYNSTGPEGLTFKAFLEDETLGVVHFFGGGSRHLYYYVPDIEGKDIEIRVEVDKTFNPLRMKISEDGRELGVAVSPVTFLKIMPKDGVGFYPWETTTEDIVGWTEGKEKRFRWTGKRASVKVSDQGSGGSGQKGKDEKRDVWVVFLRCSHPDIDKEPVGVRILGDGEVLRYVEFTDHKWKRVEIGAEELKGKEILTYEVSRTWNPRRVGIPGDGRDLGVAVGVE